MSDSTRFPVEAPRAGLYRPRMTVTPATSTDSPLAQPVTSVWGVGPERARLLARLKILIVEDLLLHQPRRYEDRRKLLAIRDLKLKEPATVRGKIVAAGIKRWKKGARALFECILDDGTALLHCRWWQAQPWMEDHFAAGREFLVFGKPDSLRPRNMDHPETELIEPGDENFIHLNRITPIYPLTEGLPQRALRSLIWRALETYVQNARESATPFPEWNRFDEKLAAFPELTSGFPSRANAVHMLHFPEALDDVEIARQRLALDEFIELQTQIQRRRELFESKSTPLPCGGDNHLIKPFLAALGFKLTDAQTSVLREIRSDLRGRHPMRRLLQGDVGSGKTVVAGCAALMAIESGFSVALMAPTEILAEQHFANFKKWLTPLGIEVELRTGSRKTATSDIVSNSKLSIQNSKLPTRNAPGATLNIGTHALLTEGFEIPNLGLVIIDEQHKFGVTQREQLVRKGRYPHLLVMTATPIPRTLGLTLYGELDVSTIDALPPGRGRIKTFARTADTLPKVWEFLCEKLKAGRQAYVVYPRVEDTGAADVKAVKKEFENLQRTLAPFKVGLLHGRLKSQEKEEVMTAFRANRVQVLLSTSLIEVGVDVPNATVMLVENAELFGLAQLHQLRGRIGRGAHDSFCILVSSAKNPEARERLKVLEETTDGFRIAEADLKLRGPGELLGQQQSGLPDFRFGNLAEDLELIRLARKVVRGKGR
ncbi:MAG TPA: ATP-dependent DNA helicase RecG [Verrucomicrobiae bacterium]|nr:ATP-dependent DNA helicase RecG [Verrucomicrobiae bacterium]